MPSRRPPLTSGSAGLNPLAESKPPAPLGPYRHTTATPHAAVRVSVRYHLWLAATCGAVPTVCTAVLCVCGVPLGREGEGGIAAGGSALLPGGGGISAGTGGTTA